MKKILMVVLFLTLIIGLFFLLNSKIKVPVQNVATTTEEPVIIGFSLGATTEERWNIDRDLFVKKAEELGAVVKVVTSNNNVNDQALEIRNLISQRVKVIVIVPASMEELSPVIQEAHDAGIKIIAYDRLIKNADIDFYLSFDNNMVGRLEAESVLKVKSSGNFAYIGGAPTDNNAFLLKEGSMLVLQEKIDSGEIRLVIDELIPDWQQDIAYSTIKTYLANGGELDAVVAANDGMAAGVIQALSEKGLSGQVPVSGQDAELAACQRIVKGTQTATVYKPIYLLADRAAVAAVAVAKDLTPETNATTNNGQIDVPSFFLEPILVNKDNMMATVVKDGFHSYNDIYKK
ncbi:MAG TPA: substrate-binding domain-containing protein [Candidatus Saccharimonadales bacterium]|nr:substrate-binding domain-containing protein [Candidatus Saccharimonadales bacterium]